MQTSRDQRLSGLYVEHAARLYAYARRHGDLATAEDLVADAFLVALRRVDDVPTDSGEARAWLIGTVRRSGPFDTPPAEPVQLADPIPWELQDGHGSVADWVNGR